MTPITFKQANEFVKHYHRHHKPVVGHKFSVAVSDGNKICGVAIAGRPVSRHLDTGFVLEVNRLCTDGTKNACSMLYAAVRRIAKSMGYEKCITYILESESGTSLKAAGWICKGKAGGKSWNVPSRPRIDKSPREMKIKYEALAAPPQKESDENNNNSAP